MPVEWMNTKKAPSSVGAFLLPGDDPDGPPRLRIILRPSRSLPRKGFAWFLLIIWGLLLVPLIPLLGTVIVWVILPFLLATLGAIWLSLERNYRDGDLLEELCLWRDLIKVDRLNPRKPSQHWQANPHWTALKLRESGGPVENYLTLKGNGREIEFGAFLSPEERQKLYQDLLVELRRVPTWR